VKLYLIRQVLFWTVDSSLWFTSNTSDSDKWRDRVYTLTCITRKQTYVGQTSRSLKLCHQEHIRYIKNNNPQSAYALHILQNRHECGPMNETMHLLKTHQQYLITNPLLHPKMPWPSGNCRRWDLGGEIRPVAVGMQLVYWSFSGWERSHAPSMQPGTLLASSTRDER